MTCAQYMELPETEQLILLCTEGVDLNMARCTPHFVVRLYAYEDFYIELFFHKSSSLPCQVNVLKEVQQLEAYLEQMDIEL